jgi:hypothetical protein
LREARGITDDKKLATMRKNPEGAALDAGENWTYRLRIVGFVDRLAAT